MIKIEKGIAIPKARTGRGRPLKYPFQNMQIGDSFLVKKKTTTQLSGVVSFARKRFPDRKFVMRTMDGGVRIFRIA